MKENSRLQKKIRGKKVTLNLTTLNISKYW